ncbi:metallophosphoesterase family protein [Phenylobacterium sp.]|jgi:serine/threonine protein phosphatase 1|uniref:metallophosphoesterase family protein n=1 Tax=Phenylobacterium sp. TaxID=1871053 RepID=UPI002F944D1F
MLGAPTTADLRPAGAAAATADLPHALAHVRADLAAACGPPRPAHLPPLAPSGEAVRTLTPGQRPARNAVRRRIPARRPHTAATTAGQLVYAVGDVHGRYDLFVELVERLAADAAANALGRQPVLVLLGDYVDRGPDSALVLEALVQLPRAADWRVVALKGNHEQALLRFVAEPQLSAQWLGFGGAATLASYGVAPPAEAEGTAGLVRARDELLAAMPAAHLHRLQTLETLAVVGDYAFVHAGVAPGVPLEDQHENDLLWIRDEFLGKGAGGKGGAGTPPAAGFTPTGHVIVHGHTWTGPRVALTPQRIGLDTGAYETGVLSAVRLDGAAVAVLQVGAVPLPEPEPAPAAPAEPAPVIGGWTPVARPTDFTRGLGYAPA